MIKEPRKSLGRGLSSLISSEDIDALKNSKKNNQQSNEGLQEMNIDQVYPNPEQPRKTFPSESLAELVTSIKKQGVIQPILVRKRDLGDGRKFEIIAGERRWRASIEAEKKTIPVILKDYNDSDAFEVAIIENIQREQLNAIEEAEAYTKLIDEYDYTQDKIAEKIGKSRSHITNLMRLLALPLDIRDMLVTKKITMGHARALLSADSKNVILQQIIDESLSVRDTEALIKKKKQSSTNKNSNKKIFAAEDDIAIIEQHVSQRLGMQVKIVDEKDYGKVIIEFNSLKELDILIKKLENEN